MKCLIHIGTLGTDTKFLQDFLSLNTYQLLKNDYLLANTVLSNRELSLVAYDPEHFDDLTSAYGVFDSKALQVLRKSIEGTLRGYTNLFSTKHLVISSEYIQTNLLAHELYNLKLMLNRIGFKQIEIILYLRSPMRLASYLFSELLRSGYAELTYLPKPFEATLASRYITNICYHQATIQRFATVFGEKNLNVRIFHNKILKNSSIIDDFASVLGLDVGADYNFPQEIKADKLSLLGMDLLARVNRRIIELKGSINFSHYKDLLNSFNQLFPEKGLVLTEELYQSYNAAFAESNEWVRRKFFPEQECLFPEREHPQLVQEHNFEAEELDRIAYMLADIWLEKDASLAS